MDLRKALRGTTEALFEIGANFAIKAISGGFSFRNSADTADAEITADQFKANGNIGLVINADGAESGDDYIITISRPSTGMTESYEFRLPVNAGSPSQVLSTDGTGNLSWISAGSTADNITVSSTDLAFGDSSPLALVTTPNNAVVHAVMVIIDTQFDGSPTLTVGVSGTTSKYMTSTQNSLVATAKSRYESSPSEAAAPSGEALIATYAAGGATQGAARILVFYSVPS